ncbi:hypothetical protein C7999DRAFT_15080 [Corynascus novoguineensis]|uniref:Uncharacterized protein n=1 Tax=Corynascus novoguineensis TaxID=1126955 RepID=A0AAN7CS11_9PEZI|nr:hypothetical protein C7999DRAFT_15080 [Corynascus novoguineensis]
MNFGWTQFSLRPNSNTRYPQPEQSAPPPCSNSEKDGEDLSDDESSDESQDGYVDLIPESPETPTPAPRRSSGNPPTSNRDSDGDASPVSTATGRPVRRRLFLEAQSSGKQSRPFPLLRPKPLFALGSGSGHLAPSSSVCSFMQEETSIPAYQARSALSQRTAIAPADPVIGWGLSGSGSSLHGIDILGNVEGRGLFDCSGVRSRSLVLMLILSCFRFSSTIVRGQGKSSTAGNDGWLRSQNGFVQWTNPVPESPFVMRDGASGASGGTPFVAHPTSPPHLPLPAALVAPLNVYAAASSSSWVQSTTIDRSNPYAVLLHANPEVLEGHASTEVQLSRGSGRKRFSWAAAANGVHGKRLRMTWDEANRKSMAHHACLPGQLLPGDNTRSPPTTRTSRTLPNFSTTYATRPDSYICPRIMEPEVAKELVENAQSVEYQLLQRKVENANASGAGQAEHQITLDNISTAVHMSCDSGTASDVDAFGYTDTEQEHPTSDYENRVTPAMTYAVDHGTHDAVADTYENEDENADTIIDGAHVNGEAAISNAGDEPNLHFYPMPIPHIPDVDPIHMYDPLHNPAAAYWTTLPDEGFVGEVYDLLGMERPTISMYGNPPLPAFDTDPFLPFAPWRVNKLPAFQPESAHRVLTVAAAYLPALGRLYPDATFLVARHPPSANFTARLKGAALATSVALHFPHLVNPSALMDTPGYHGTGEIDNVVIEADKYIVSLVQRDWPVGGVAFLPNTPSAANFIAAVRDAFDVLPGGQEVFYFLSCDVPLVGGNGDGGNKGVYVCRAYEGRKGPQDGRIIDDWLRTQGAKGVPQDEFGREVLVRMGEAWVEPERWPRRKRGGSNKKGDVEMEVEGEEKDEREE